MINNIMKYFNVINYRYDIPDKILFIYQPVKVELFVNLRRVLNNTNLVDNVIIKSKRGVIND